MYEGRDMHIMSAVNLHIKGKHVRRSAERLARTDGIPAVRGGPELTMGSAQLWKGGPFVAILNLPGQPAQSAPFLLTFSSALIGGQTVTDPSHQELATGAAFVIGMPQRFVCKEGDWMLVWEGAGGGKLMQVEYTASEWVNLDLEKGVWLLQAGFLDCCPQQLTPRTQAAPLLPRGTVAYEGVALLPAMVRAGWGGCVPRAWLWDHSTAGEDADSHCVPPTLRNTPPPLLWLLQATRLCPPHAARKGGGATCVAGFLRKRVFL